jgi:hypothetical protein
MTAASPCRWSLPFTGARAAGTLALGFQFAGPYARQLPLTVCIDEVSVTRVQ